MSITPDQVIAACPLPATHPARAAFDHAVKIVVPMLVIAHPYADVKSINSCMVAVLKAARLVQKCPESMNWPRGSEQHPLATACCLSGVSSIDPRAVLTAVAAGPAIP
jgi:hypothetical protein